MFNTESLEIHRKFAEQTGSYAIAKHGNIDAIFKFCQRKSPQRILEIGGGIGTLTCTVLTACDASVDSYEENEYCRSRMHENLEMWADRYRIIDNYDKLPPENEYDLVIIDGPSSLIVKEPLGELTERFIETLDSVGSLFIEGLRFEQRRGAQRAIAKKTCYRLEKIRGVKSSKQELSKGGLFIHPTKKGNGFTRRMHHLYWTMTDWFDLSDPFRRSRIKKRVFRKIHQIMEFIRPPD